MINGQLVEVIPVRLRRNRSWLSSVKLGFRAGILWAPTTLYRTVRFPVGAILVGTGLLLLGCTVWGISRALIVVAGLLGFVSKKD